ncbi:right-handed parallel beta-helix repeat-containing protein [Geodermatophilus sp. SYSU D00710]
MDRAPTTRHPRVRRALAVAGAGTLLVAAAPGAASAQGGGGRTWDVRPGQSIQDAVDAADSGDTIRLAPGTYAEAVCIEGKGLTIRGAGAAATKIVWPGWDTPEDLPPAPARSSVCWAAQERVDGEDDPDTLADDVSALFFLDPDGPVRVSGVMTRNHPASGITAWGADGFSVSDTVGHAHDGYGILALDSTNVRFTGNIEVGLDRGTASRPDSGTAGIGIEDSAAAAANVSGNYVEGYDLGIHLREARGGHVSGNTLTGNCIGLLLFDDVVTQVPDDGRDVPSGGFHLSGNRATDNDRYCRQGRDEDEHVSGVGVQVVNADDVSITGNVVTDNTVTLPESVPVPTNPAGGLTLLSLPAPDAPEGASAGLVDDIRIVGNAFGDNHVIVRPGRVVERDVFVSDGSIPPLLAAGPDLTSAGNRCDASLPADICGAPPYPAD